MWRWGSYRTNLVVGWVAHEELVLLRCLVSCLRISRMLLWVVLWTLTYSHLHMWGEHFHNILFNQIICLWISDGIVEMLTCPCWGTCTYDWSCGSIRCQSLLPDWVPLLGILLGSLSRWGLRDVRNVLHLLNIKSEIACFIVVLQSDISNSDLVHLWGVPQTVIALSWWLGILIRNIAFLLDSLHPISSLFEL